MGTGVISTGIQCPVIRQGDDLKQIVISSVLVNKPNIENGTVIGITESVVARAQGNYVTIDQIVENIKTHDLPKEIGLWKPIMSRNRFSLILRAFARYAKKLTIYIDNVADGQGNPTKGVNPFTGVDIQDYYEEICAEEHCVVDFKFVEFYDDPNDFDQHMIDAQCHPDGLCKLTLKDFCSTLSYTQGWSEWGLLGSNKADDERLKLFPRECHKLCQDIQTWFKENKHIDVEVLVYGDGCFKDPVGGIWEFADPVTCPGYTQGLEGTPNELKLKAFADNEYKDLDGDELNKAVKDAIRLKTNRKDDLKGSMQSQGTTPRRYIDLLASLMDLTSGSGDKGTPIVVVENYFRNYAS